jgi:hypothetical protein
MDVCGVWSCPRCARDARPCPALGRQRIATLLIGSDKGVPVRQKAQRYGAFRRTGSACALHFRAPCYIVLFCPSAVLFLLLEHSPAADYSVVVCTRLPLSLTFRRTLLRLTDQHLSSVLGKSSRQKAGIRTRHAPRMPAPLSGHLCPNWACGKARTSIHLQKVCLFFRMAIALVEHFCCAR